MIREFNVKHISIPGADCIISIDPETGLIGGRDAPMILPDLIRAKEEGYFAPPGSFGVKIKDPFRNLAEFAVVCFQGYEIPEDLVDPINSLQWDEDDIPEGVDL